MNQKRLLAAVLLGLSLVACAEPATDGVLDPVTDTIPPVTVVPVMEDGSHFGFITVEHDGQFVVLELDEAEMLSGEQAHDAAVDAGVIGADEDLPNDFFIVNDDDSVEQVRIAPDAVITVLSGTDPGQTIDVDGEVLNALFDGSYTGEAVYGIVPGQPAAFEIQVEGDLVTGATEVYLP